MMTESLYFMISVISVYGTKWNGNAAANNGSLFVVQDKRIRRLTPVECERLMGFDDNYTALDKSRRTERYTAIGNAWAVPVIRWIGNRMNNGFEPSILMNNQIKLDISDYEYIDFGTGIGNYSTGIIINCSTQPEESSFGTMKDIISPMDVDEKLYITPVACHGILRRGGKK